MCGICGISRSGSLEVDDKRTGTRELDLLRHRGPDGTGKWVDENAGVFLGNTRLAIVDPTPDSDQPMVRDDHVLITNGEIYNYQELRTTLERRGVEFRTTGDTEVLLEMWREYGLDALNRIEGMFAFAIWDGESIHLAVDPFGEKQLFYANLPHSTVVSSELGALAEIVDASRDLSGEKLTEYLSLGHVAAPETAYENLYRLPPATYIRVQDGQIEAKRRYWSPPTPNLTAGGAEKITEQILNRVRDALVTSLDERLRTDVPLCLFLSSGTDSALIAALARHELDTDLECITVAYDDESGTNEASAAANIAEYLDHDHHIVYSSKDPRETAPNRILNLFGQPNDSLTAASIEQISREATELGYKVGLTGMGGDEIFRGYNKHTFFHQYKKFYHLPETARKTAARAMGILSPLLSNSSLRHVNPLFGVDDEEVYLANKNYPAINWIQRLPEYGSWLSDAFEISGRGPELWVPEYELAEVMPNSHLRSMDVGSMRASVELRTPYLDRRLLGILSDLDPRTLVAHGQKEVLRRLLARYLPDHLVELPKQGFIFPRSRFLENVKRTPQSLPGIPDSMTREAWNRRHEQEGWERIAVRLALADAFLQDNN